MSRLKPKPPAMCAACKLLPAEEDSSMCQGCRNRARQLVAAYLGRQDLPDVLVLSPPGSGWS